MNYTFDFLPLTRDENICELLSYLENAIKSCFNRKDISIAHRLFSLKHSHLIVQFTMRSEKEDWTFAARGDKDRDVKSVMYSFQ